MAGQVFGHFGALLVVAGEKQVFVAAANPFRFHVFSQVTRVLGSM